jgi:hypothetical protein
MVLKHKTLQIALFAPALIIATSHPANAAAPSFASSAKPASAAPASAPAPAPTLDSSGSAATPSSGTAGNTAPPLGNQSLGQTKSAPTPGPAAVPAQTVTNQALRQNVVRNANTSADGDNSVQSFFQCAPISVSSKEIERRQTAIDKKPDTEFSLKKALYHTLDNIGVPMFTGRTDSQLAPGISRAYIDPPTPSLGKNKNPEEIEKLFSQQASVAGGKPNQSPKIPLSELEGTGFDNVPDANAEIHTALPETHAKTN